LSEAAAEAARTASSEMLLRLASEVESGRIGIGATAKALQSRLGLSTQGLSAIRRLMNAATDVGSLPTVIRVAVATADRIRGDGPTVEVAATQPRGGGHIRTTGGVARDIVTNAADHLLIVGYSVTADPALAGLAAKTLAAIGRAALRGVTVTAILHRQESNRDAILRAWPSGSPPARFYTWPEQPNDAMAKMHAKVLVADARDAFVTSANLTYHGFVGNVEMGVRIIGRPAREIARLFERLIINGEFVEWNP
jgi:phosphatidylserine/phosphatidylglycerophosphate/cardiolipin synthase-like enzyme